MESKFLLALFRWLGMIKKYPTDGLSEAKRIEYIERKVCPKCGCSGIEILDTSTTAWNSTSTETREATIKSRDGDQTGSIEWEVEVPVRSVHTEKRLCCWFCDAEYTFTITET
jgi:hypothetical protein